MGGTDEINCWRMSTILVIVATIVVGQVSALPDILEPLPAVPRDTPTHESGTDTSQSKEPLPKPLPLASPERSSVDENHFNMAASYLKSQFSIPHHLVPSYQDTAHWLSSFPDSAEDRIRRLPNLQNHQLDNYPDSSSNDYEYIDNSNEFQLEEDARYKRRPDLDYTWAQEQEPGQKVYRNGKQKTKNASKNTRKPLRSKKRPQHKPKQIKSNVRYPRNPAQFQSFGPHRMLPVPHVPKNLNFLAAMTSQLRNGLSNALTGNRRHAAYPLGVQPGYLRKQLPSRRGYPKESPPDYEDYNDNRIAEDLPGTRHQGRGRYKLATRPSQGVLTVNFPNRPHQTRGHHAQVGGGNKRRELNKNKNNRKRRRKGQNPRIFQDSKTNSNNRENIKTERFDQFENTRRQDMEEAEAGQEQNGQSSHTFDGLDMDFWEDDVEQATKPDYRRRWKDLNMAENDDKENNKSDGKNEMNTEEAVGSRRFFEVENQNQQEKQSVNKVSSENDNIGWGEKMWKEIEDDWNKDGEKWKKYKVRKRKKEKLNKKSKTEENVSEVQDMSIIDDGARYLSAWADAGEILEPQTVDEKSPSATKSEDMNFQPSVPYNEDFPVKLEDENPKKEVQSISSYSQKQIYNKFTTRPIKRRPTRTRTLQNLTFRNR